VPDAAAGHTSARAEGGSALLLVPAAVLVLVILASITVDSAIAFLGQRELANAAAAAANDAATAALSDRAFYQGGEAAGPGELLIDGARAREVATHAVADRISRGVRVDGLDVTVSAGGTQACVTVRGRVDFVFARALPGVPHHAAVRGRAAATAITGQGGTAPRPVAASC
jgi:Flp pilus assembly protein TadG